MIPLSVVFRLLSEPMWLMIPVICLVIDLWKGISPRNSVLIAFSLFFYSWGEPVLVLLLIFTSVLDYLSGLFIEKHRGQKKAVLGIIVSCAADLS